MSIRWMGVLTWVAAMTVVWVVFTPAMISGTGLALVTVLGFLVVWTTLTTVMRSPRSIAKVIADTEKDTARAVARQAESPARRFD
jgi:hypothetical protein